MNNENVMYSFSISISAWEYRMIKMIPEANTSGQS